MTGNARVSSLFSRTLPDGTVDAGSDAAQLKDGGIAVIGETGTDALVARFGPLGESEWSMGYGTTGVDHAMAALPTRGGALAVVGDTAAAGSPSDAFGMEIDPATGDVLRAWTLGGAGDDRLTAVAHDPVQPPNPGWPPDPDVVIQQGWIAAGSTRSFGMGGDDGLLLRADNDGNPMWALALGGEEDEHVEAVAKTPDDGILAVGPTSGRAFVARFELDGRPSWMKSFGSTTPGDLVPRGVVALADGGFVVVGDGPSASGLPETDLWVARFDRLGFPRWSRMLVAPGDQSGAGVEELVDGNLVVVGSTQAPGGTATGWIVRLDREGTVLSQRSYGGPMDDELRDVRRREGLGFVVAGTRGVTDGGGNESTDAWLLALGMNGELADGCALVADTSASTTSLPLTSSDPGFVVTAIEPTTMPWNVTAHAEPVMHAPELHAARTGRGDRSTVLFEDRFRVGRGAGRGRVPRDARRRRRSSRGGLRHAVGGSRVRNGVRPGFARAGPGVAIPHPRRQCAGHGSGRNDEHAAPHARFRRMPCERAPPGPLPLYGRPSIFTSASDRSGQ